MRMTLLALWLLSIAQLSAAEPAPLKAPCCKELPVSSHITDGSIYQLDSAWTSDVGKKVTLRVFQGNPVVLVLFYTSCEFACPVLMTDLKRLEQEIRLRGIDPVTFLLVSMDGKRDSPAVLHAYREHQQLDLEHWALLQGSDDDVRELAALLGIQIKAQLNGRFAHSNVISILNREGEVVHQQIGLKQSPEESLQALKRSTSPKKGG